MNCTWMGRNAQVDKNCTFVTGHTKEHQSEVHDDKLCNGRWYKGCNDEDRTLRSL